MNSIDWRVLFERHLPEPRRALLQRVGHVAEASGLPLYCVGGFVRDLLLGLTPRDFDFVVDGDAPTLARALARALGGEVLVHTPFGTATWSHNGAAVDFATARVETYPHPAALPVVAPAPIAEDLRRRDFTINAIALRVDGAHFGALLDPHHGQADLAARVIRSLHPGSFLDDPTRIFRAVRYAARLDFNLAPETLGLIPSAWEALDALTGARLWNEFGLIFREPRAAEMLERLHALEVLAHAHPALNWSARASQRAGCISRIPAAEWKMPAPPEPDAPYLALMLEPASNDGVASALTRLNVTRAVSDAVVQAHDLAVGWSSPSEAVAALDAVTELAVVTAWVLNEAHPQLHRYLAEWRFVRAATTGDDLIALGLAPGPKFKEILWKARAARLDGGISDAAGERALVRRFLDESRA